MYEAFDLFLSAPTWHTKHELDEERFFRTLRSVIHLPDFDPEGLKMYIMKVKNGELTDGALTDAAEHYSGIAEVVMKYLDSQHT